MASDADKAANQRGGSHSEQELLDLCRLVIGLPREDLHAALQRVTDRAEFTEHLSKVLADAIRLGQSRNQHFADAVAPVISKGVHETVQKDAAAFGKALAPAMGPAIRQSVLFMIRGLLDSFESMVAQRLSVRSLMWRYEAWRTGRSFPEVFFLKTLVYRVEHVLMIHRETGVLLARVSAPDAPVADPELVSAMLTAIQDFVSDAFVAPEGDTLGSFQVGELSVLVEDGEGVVLAGVVRGAPKQQIRLQLRETLEQVQLDYASAIARFDGDPALFESAEPILQACIGRQAIAGQAKKPKGESLVARLRQHWLMCTALVAVLVAGILYWVFTAIEAGRWRDYVAALRTEPGLAVTHTEWRDGRLQISGLRDPMARDAAAIAASLDLDPDVVEGRWQDAILAVPEFILRRAKAGLHPPPGVLLTMQGGVLKVQGKAGHAWVERCRELVPLAAQGASVDLSGLVDVDVEGYAKAKKELESLTLAAVDVKLGAIGLGHLETSLRRLVDYGAVLGVRPQVVCTIRKAKGAATGVRAAVEGVFGELRGPGLSTRIEVEEGGEEGVRASFGVGR